MDPLKTFPAEIAELILLHLTGAELKRATLVNPNWNEAISSSKACMSKLKLTVVELNRVDDVKSVLMDGRIYENISISDQLSEENAVNFAWDVLNIRKQWKSVEIYCFSFPFASDYHKLLKVIESTVERLVLSGIKIGEDMPAIAELNFPNLKSLTILHCDETVNLDAFRHSPQLEALDFCTKKSDASVVEFLQAHGNLRSLRLNTKLFNTVFAFGSQNFSFSLEQLAITNYGASVRVWATEENFLAFLQQQAATLKKLQLDDWHGLSVMSQAFEMKNLVEVKFANLPMLDWDATNFSTSQSIRILDLITIDTRNIRRIEVILASVPSIRQLRLRSISLNIVAFIKQNLKSLEKIKLVHPNFAVIGKLYPNVEFE